MQFCFGCGIIVSQKLSLGREAVLTFLNGNSNKGFFVNYYMCVVSFGLLRIRIQHAGETVNVCLSFCGKNF